MKRRASFLFFWTSFTLAQTPPLFHGLRFQLDTYSTREPVFAEEVYFRRPLFWKAFAEGAVRGKQFAKGFFSADYKLEVQVPWFSFFSTQVRLLTQNLVADGYSATTLLGTSDLTIPIYHFGFYFSAGYYLKYTSLGVISVLPSFATGGLVDDDVAVHLGLYADLSPHTRLSALISSYDSFDAFYFHNAYIEAQVRYQPEGDWVYLFYMRYKTLLGFGQLDGWSGGIALKVPTS